MLVFPPVSSLFLTREERNFLPIFRLAASFSRLAVAYKLKIAASEHLCKLLFGHDRLLCKYARVRLHIGVVVVAAGGKYVIRILLCPLPCNSVVVILEGVTVPHLYSVKDEFLRHRTVCSEGMRLNEHAAVISHEACGPVLVLQIYVGTAVVKFLLKSVHKIVRTESTLEIHLSSHKNVKSAPCCLLHLSVALNEVLHLLGQRSVLHMLKGALCKMLGYDDGGVACLQICFYYALCLVSRTAAYVSGMAVKLRFIFIQSVFLHIIYV